MKLRFVPFLLLGAAALSAQSSFQIQRTLEWTSEPYRHTLSGGDVVEQWRFADCDFSDEAPTLPLFMERFPLPGRSRLTVEINSVQYEPIALKTTPDAAVLGDALDVQTIVEQERNRFFGRVRFYPIRKVGNGYERVTSFALTVRIRLPSRNWPNRAAGRTPQPRF
jgi:hypothetical protein